MRSAARVPAVAASLALLLTPCAWAADAQTKSDIGKALSRWRTVTVPCITFGNPAGSHSRMCSSAGYTRRLKLGSTEPNAAADSRGGFDASDITDAFTDGQFMDQGAREAIAKGAATDIGIHTIADVVMDTLPPPWSAVGMGLGLADHAGHMGDLFDLKNAKTAAEMESAAGDHWVARPFIESVGLMERAIELLQRMPIITTAVLVDELRVTKQAARVALDQLVERGVLRNRGRAGRTQLFAAEELISLLSRPFGSDAEAALEKGRALQLGSS